MKQEMIDKNQPVFPISVVAGILEVHERTLRIWDNEGILTPKRTAKNRRIYSFNDIEKAKLILFLGREAGVNISGIKIVFQLLDDIKALYKNPDGFNAKHELEDVFEQVGITTNMMKENKDKLGRRGRKKAVCNV